MSDTVIRVENLSKKYVLSHQQEKGSYKALRDVIADGAKSVGKKLLKPSKASVNPGREEFWALKDVSFEIKQGDRVGIIGRNGAGKSTLLKVLSRIVEPTKGSISINGRVASLLEVGTGFHPELTGRENVYLNGAILGMERAEIVRKFDEIVAFAEVEKFLDTPVKRYSSGMYVKLAFSVAAHLEPEVLIVDEVLAVGDIQFQKKCLNKMEEIATQGGRTVIFVSHNMAAIAKLCNTAIFLQSGQVSFSGNCEKAVQIYLAAGYEKSSNSKTNLNFSRRRFRSESIQITEAWLERNRERTEEFLFGDNDVEVVIVVQILQEIEFSTEILLRDSQEQPVAFAPSGLGQDKEFHEYPGQIEIRCKLPSLQLAQGKYSIDLMLAMAGVKFFDYVESGLTFTVSNSAIGNQNWTFSQGTGQGCFLWDVKYKIDSDQLEYPSQPVNLNQQRFSNSN